MAKKIFFDGSYDVYHLDMLLKYKVSYIAIDYAYATENKINTKILRRVEDNPDVCWMLLNNKPDSINNTYRNWGNSGLFTYVWDYSRTGINGLKWNGKQTLIGSVEKADEYSAVRLLSSYPVASLSSKVSELRGNGKEVLLVGRRHGLKYPSDLYTIKEWMSSERFGTVFIFTANTFMRIPHKNRHLINTHMKTIRDMGLNYKKIVDGDREESLRLSILSWKYYTEQIMALDDIHGSNSDTDSSIKYGTPLNIGSRDDDNAVVDSVVPTDSQTPGLIVAPKKKSGLSKSSRIGCNTCALKERCESYQANHMCCLNTEFEHFQDLTIPAVLDTMKQLLEEQTTRLNRSIHAEELIHGNIPTSQINREITQIQRNYSTLLQILQEREKMDIEKSSLLKELFGDIIDAEVEVEPVEKIQTENVSVNS